MSYVDAGYSIALGILFLYAVALVLRRRRWERALRVSEHVQVAEVSEHAAVSEHAEISVVTEHAEHAEVAGHAEVTVVSERAEVTVEQGAPGTRS